MINDDNNDDEIKMMIMIIDEYDEELSTRFSSYFLKEIFEGIILLITSKYN
jgi:hypothetical protein